MERNFINNIESEQLRIFAHFYNLLDIGSGGEKVPLSFLESNKIPYNSREDFKASNLQDRVLRGLQGALDASAEGKNLYILSEESSFDGIFPVDAIIVVGNKFKPSKYSVLAIVEIDGPQHYREDGSLRRKDLLKEFMYSRKHPNCQFFRIRYDEANRLGEDVIGNNLAMKVIKIFQANKSPIASFFQNIYSSTEKAFVWSMRNKIFE